MFSGVTWAPLLLLFRLNICWMTDYYTLSTLICLRWRYLILPNAYHCLLMMVNECHANLGGRPSNQVHAKYKFCKAVMWLSLYCNLNIVPFRIDLLIAIQLSVLLSPIRSIFSKLFVQLSIIVRYLRSFMVSLLWNCKFVFMVSFDVSVHFNAPQLLDIAFNCYFKKSSLNAGSKEAFWQG